MKSGIYQILNLANDKRYIGSSSNVSQRFWGHRSSLKNGRHHNSYLQRAYNAYGSENFKIEVIEYCEIDKLIEREQFWIDFYDFETLYNNRRIADSNRGVRHTEEFKSRRRIFRHTDDAKKRIKESAIGRKNGPLSTETKAKLSAALKGKTGNKGSIKKGERRGVQTQFKAGNKSWNEGMIGVIKSWNKGTKGLCKANITSFKPSVKFIFVSPDNVLYEGVGLEGFSREMDLDAILLGRVLTGRNRHHKGWKLPKEGDIYNGIGLFN